MCIWGQNLGRNLSLQLCVNGEVDGEPSPPPFSMKEHLHKEICMAEVPWQTIRNGYFKPLIYCDMIKKFTISDLL